MTDRDDEGDETDTEDETSTDNHSQPSEYIINRISNLYKEMKDEMRKGMKEGWSEDIEIDQDRRDSVHREPYIEATENESEVRVVADLPGVSREDIEIKALESEVMLKAVGNNISYDEEIELPSKVQVKSATATYKNGVLEVVFSKSD